MFRTRVIIIIIIPWDGLLRVGLGITYLGTNPCTLTFLHPVNEWVWNVHKALQVDFSSPILHFSSLSWFMWPLQVNVSWPIYICTSLPIYVTTWRWLFLCQLYESFAIYATIADQLSPPSIPLLDVWFMQPVEIDFLSASILYNHYWSNFLHLYECSDLWKHCRSAFLHPHELGFM